MRKFLSIALLLLASAPLVLPLFALSGSPESRLPACCRRSGAHHCMISAEQMAALTRGRHFTRIRSRCPLFPKAVAPAPHEALSQAAASAVYAGVVSHPAQFFQVEARARVALSGARHKRGPPAVRLS